MRSRSDYLFLQLTILFLPHFSESYSRSDAHDHFRNFHNFKRNNQRYNLFLWVVKPTSNLYSWFQIHVIYFSSTDIVSVAIKKAAITLEKWSQFLIPLLANGDINKLFSYFRSHNFERNKFQMKFKQRNDPHR